MNLSILDQQPKETPERSSSLLLEELKTFNRKIVVLDDDPTGVQTVHDIFVYTDWEEDTIRQAFEDPNQMFFLLTNSRSFSAEETRKVHQDIADRIGRVAKDLNLEFVLISRGDSTLRGHYPLETQTLCSGLEAQTGIHFHGEIICPFFLEGGRYTLGGIHYVKEGNELTPAGETEFAKDKTFGYHSSLLSAYVEEKSNGISKQADCIEISLAELRSYSFDTITDKLLKADHFAKIIVNAIAYSDIQIFCTAWIRAMKQGHNYIARSAAALPKVLGNSSDIPLLTAANLFSKHNRNGGLIIVGSHVQKTTDQLNSLMESTHNLKFFEFDVNAYFKPGRLELEVKRLQQIAEQEMAIGTTVVIYTSRTLLAPDTADKDIILAASVNIAAALTQIVKTLKVQPGFLIAKGGITSSDIGTNGLGVKKALVLGQIKKGIPVWQTGVESKFPMLPYIIFPGNVGEVTTLKEIAEMLT